MCIEQNYVDGRFVSCRNCWQCREDRVNQLVGRCIAEKQYSDRTFAVTLTYGVDGPNSATLVLKDFQDFMKRLRVDGYRVRYLVAGEYGTKKGRAHWHAVLFFKGKIPPLGDPSNPKSIQMEKRFNWQYWDHGFVYFQDLTRNAVRGIRYAMKYALKDVDSRGSANKMSLSKKPILGDQFVTELAWRYVRAGLEPKDLSYQVHDGENRTYWLSGKAQELFEYRFFRFWTLTYPDRPLRSEWVSVIYDRQFERFRNAVSLDDDWVPLQREYPAPPVIHPDGFALSGWLRSTVYQGLHVDLIQWDCGSLSIWDDERKEYWHVKQGEPAASLFALDRLRKELGVRLHADVRFRSCASRNALVRAAFDRFWQDVVLRQNPCKTMCWKALGLPSALFPQSPSDKRLVGPVRVYPDLQTFLDASGVLNGTNVQPLVED